MVNVCGLAALDFTTLRSDANAWAADEGAPTKEEQRSMMYKKSSEVPFSEAALRERRAARNTYQLLWRLRKKTEERDRLTRQLMFLVNSVASEIADMCQIGTTAEVKGIGLLKVELWTSNIESKKVLVFDNAKTEEDARDEGGYELPGAAFGFDVEPATRFFFNGDMSAQGRAASRENYLSFALHVADVVEAFAVKQDVIISRLLSAFESLRHMVGST
jgi:hypothetical protein